MTITDPFRRRELALENRFFSKMDQELIQRLREKAHLEQGREKLARVTGIGDAAVIQELIDDGIRAETVVTLSLVPLILVARAGKGLDLSEHAAILDAVVDAGLEPDSASYQLFLAWIQREPDQHLLETWEHYIEALCHSLPKEQIARMQEDILIRCREVARSVGGSFGRGRVSSKEEEMLTRIESAFLVAG